MTEGVHNHDSGHGLRTPEKSFSFYADSLHIRHVSNLEIGVEFCLLTIQLIILIQSDH